MDNFKNNRNHLFIAAIILVSLNLRAPIIGVSPLVETIRTDLSLSGGVAGFLTTIPLLVFASVSPISGLIAHKVGLGRSLFFAMIFIIAGICVRSWAGFWGLILGTFAIGVGIGIANVLVPVAIKARYPQKIGMMTGLYASAMSFSAAGAAALAVPLASAGLGWRGSLGVWCVPALCAAAIWMALRKFTHNSQNNKPAKSIWKSKIAWYCTLYMGTQSILFYSISSWLPSILVSKGISASVAGVIASVYQLVAIPVNFLVPMVAERFKDQRKLTLSIVLAYFFGVLLLWLGKSPAVLWAATVICGACTAATFSLCMALIGLRTQNAEDAANLSGMLHSIGYLIAAVGPVFYGKLFDLSGSWSFPTFVLVIGVILNAIAGRLAGRPGYVE